MAMITQNSFSLFSFFSLDGKERNKAACRRQGKDQDFIFSFPLRGIYEPARSGRKHIVLILNMYSLKQSRTETKKGNPEGLPCSSWGLIQPIVIPMIQVAAIRKMAALLRNSLLSIVMVLGFLRK